MRTQRGIHAALHSHQVTYGQNVYDGSHWVTLFTYTLRHVQAAAGDLDPTFGTGGKVTTDFAALADVAQSLAVQSDGRIIAAGYAEMSSSNIDYPQ